MKQPPIQYLKNLKPSKLTLIASITLAIAIVIWSFSKIIFMARTGGPAAQDSAGWAFFIMPIMLAMQLAPLNIVIILSAIDVAKEKVWLKIAKIVLITVFMLSGSIILSQSREAADIIEAIVFSLCNCALIGIVIFDIAQRKNNHKEK